MNFTSFDNVKWDPKVNPLKHFELTQCSIEFTDDMNIATLSRKIHASVMDQVDDTILKTIINCAKEEGVDDLYLLDKEFVMSAIKHELERRGLNANR